MKAKLIVKEGVYNSVIEKILSKSPQASPKNSKQSLKTITPLPLINE